jgi:hypothetical protein
VNVELGLNDRVVDLAEEGWDLAVSVAARNHRQVCSHSSRFSARIG